MGLNGTTPLIALRSEYDPDAGDVFAPAYFALIDKQDVPPETLWVKDQQIYAGPSADNAPPYRASDFVLYSIVRPLDNRRSDLDQFAFNEVWERVLKEAAVPKDENYESAREHSELVSDAVAQP